jgi:hypothetical protein
LGAERRWRDDRGIALPMAIFALVIVGVLVAAAFFVGRQEQLVGRNTIRLQQAFAAAEAGAQYQAAVWDPQGLNRLAVDDSLPFEGTLAGSGWYRGAVRRLSTLLFLIRSEGFSPDSTARQQVGLLVRLRPIEVRVRAGLEAVGPTDIAGASAIDGTDNLPFGWSGCPLPGPPLPGLRVSDAGLVATSGGCGGLACVSGSPPVVADPTVTPAALARIGDVEFDSLRGWASKIVPGGTRRPEPSVTAGRCVAGDPNNWGSPLQPLGPCGGYFPVVWVDGDLTISGGQGQGVLLVSGDLTVQGNFEFYGAVIVSGSVQTVGTGGRFTGGLVVINGRLASNRIHGNTVVRYSSCALERARVRSARASLLRERSWVNLY